MSDDVLARATALADDVLFARALDTDDQDVLPEANLDALADLGLYGIFAPPELGGLGADLPMMCELVEIIASGCLTTALVWVQHFGLLGPTGLDDELIERRAALDAADADTMAIERAAASELALRAAAALAVHDGSRALRRDEHAQRLLREAMFLLVFGSRQPIKESLLARLTRR
jgi:alkylation response protein AidB-like acyl-CoA dehydrogenase